MGDMRGGAIRVMGRETLNLTHEGHVTSVIAAESRVVSFVDSASVCRHSQNHMLELSYG